MKAAVISHGSPDYLVDIVADGLLRLLGRDNVHLRYNRVSTEDSTKSQLFHGFSVQNKIDFLEANILIASVRSDTSAIEAWVRETGGGRVAIVDGEDDPIVRQQYYSIASIYFKREFLSNTVYQKLVRPLPFAAIPEDVLQPSDRDIRVTFAGQVRGSARAEIVQACWEMGIPIDAALRPKREYNSILSRSMIGLSARGAGWDTYRYWETAYFGCALLSQRLGIVIPENFVDGVEAVFFDGMNDFREKLGALLADPARALALGKSAQKACLERHLSINRAKTLLEEMP